MVIIIQTYHYLILFVVDQTYYIRCRRPGLFLNSDTLILLYVLDLSNSSTHGSSLLLGHVCTRNLLQLLHPLQPTWIQLPQIPGHLSDSNNPLTVVLHPFSFSDSRLVAAIRSLFTRNFHFLHMLGLPLDSLCMPRLRIHTHFALYRVFLPSWVATRVHTSTSMTPP
jgi:hypothetical protein